MKILKFGFYCGLFFAGRWTAPYTLDIKPTDSPPEPHHTRMYAEDAMLLDTSSVAEALLIAAEAEMELEERPIIKMVPGFIYDERHHALVKLPPETQAHEPVYVEIRSGIDDAIDENFDEFTDEYED